MSHQLNPIIQLDIRKIESKLSPVTDLSNSSFNEQDSLLSSLRSDVVGQFSVANCLLSISPSGDVAVVGNRKSLVVLTSKCHYSNEDVNRPQEIFKVSAVLNCSEDDSNTVTAVLCAPLPFLGQSGRQRDVTVGWTCVVVGYSSGLIEFYDECGLLVLSKQLHHEPITAVKCQSLDSMNLNQDEHTEEVYVLSQSLLIIFSGSVLFDVLRKRRSDLAKGFPAVLPDFVDLLTLNTHNSRTAGESANWSKSAKAPLLTYKLYTFTRQERITDCEVVGLCSLAQFDHLRRASKLGGFDTKYQKAAPKMTKVVACGKNDFLGYHYGTETASGVGSMREMVSLLYHAAVDIYTKKKLPAGDTILRERLEYRYSLPDPGREGRHICRSPNLEYLAVTDNLGRVSLIDSARGVVVRIFKGKRDAQCGWLTVEDVDRVGQPRSKDRPRSVHLLVIYLDRSGVLELWKAPHGGLLKPLNCGKGGRLIYNAHRFVGQNGSVDRTLQKWRQCVFLNEEGCLYEINVPFHCILGDGEERRYAHDRFLVRKLQNFLQEKIETDEEVAQEAGVTAATLDTTKGRLECLKLLSSHRKSCPEAVEAAVSIFIDKITKDGTEKLESSVERLLNISQQLRGLTSYFMYIQRQRDRPPDYFTLEGCSEEPQRDLSSELFASRREVSNLKMRLSMRQKRSTDDAKRVTFDERPTRSLFVEYLSYFEIGKKVQNFPEDDEGQPSAARHSVSVRRSDDKESCARSELGELIFRDVLFSESDLSVFREEVLESGISPMQLTLLAVSYWLSIDLRDRADREIIRFSEILCVICHLEAESKIAADYNKISPWWGRVRDVLAASTSPLNALAAAIACRAVAIRIECQIDDQYYKNAKLLHDTWSDTDEESTDSEDSSGGKNKKKKKKSSTGDWEVMSADRAQWNRLIGRLEDVAILDCILCRNPRSETKNLVGEPLPALPFEKPVISLLHLFSDGCGSVSKLVARWLASAGIVPKSLVDSTDVEWQPLKERSQSRQKKTARLTDLPQSFFQDSQAEDVVVEGKEPFASQCLRILKWHFPFSLTGSVLLTYLSLEYSSEWHQNLFSPSNPPRPELLSAALSCLETIPSPYLKKGSCVLAWNEYVRHGFHLLGDSFTKASIAALIPGTTRRLNNRDATVLAAQCLGFARLLVEANEIRASLEPLEGESAFYQCEDLWKVADDENNCDEWERQGYYCTLSKVSTLREVREMSALDENQLSLILEFSHVVQLMMDVQSISERAESDFSCLMSTEDTKKSKETRELLNNLFSTRLNLVHAPLAPPSRDRRFLQTNFPKFEKVQRHRVAFVQSVVKISLTSLPNNSSVWHRTDVQRRMPVLTEALPWLARCEELAWLWELDCDKLRQYQVCLLYSQGLDPYAEEIFATVKDQREIAEDLLLIAGKRLKLLADDPLYVANLCPLESPLYDWIQELETDDIRRFPDEHKTKWIARLVAKVVNICDNYRCRLMFEALKPLEAWESQMVKSYHRGLP